MTEHAREQKQGLTGKSITARKMVKMIILLITAFAAALTLAVLLLYASSRIPDDRVRENFEKSADILCEKEVFFCAYQNAACSKIDRYADSILLNIAWNLKSDLPSLMWSRYYSIKFQNENYNFYDAVHGDKKNSSPETMKEYVRYWHGSAAIMRILHVFMNIRGVYLLHAVLLMLLTVILIVLLALKKKYAEAVSFIIGMISVNVWFVPLSLEYYWTFLCMLVTSILVIELAARQKTEWFPFLFFMTGIVTAYLDFLSTETITLTVPLLLACRYECKKETISRAFRQCAAISIIWGIGYVGMWVSKWILAAFITGENILPYVKGHVSERIGRNISGMSRFSLLFGGIGKNLSCLFPWGYGLGGIIVGIAILVVALYIGFVYRSGKKTGGNRILYAMIAAIPYGRYFVMFNHSIMHYFFTYRAQIIAVMILSLALFETVDWGLIKKTHEKKGKTKKRGRQYR